MALQLAYFDRARAPVITEVSPVLDLEDVIGGKVAAMASRAYERDYLDTAAALGRYSPAELIGFARRLDPGLDSPGLRRGGSAAGSDARLRVHLLWAQLAGCGQAAGAVRRLAPGARGRHRGHR